jgi:hypothetical protein
VFPEKNVVAFLLQKKMTEITINGTYILWKQAIKEDIRSESKRATKKGDIGDLAQSLQFHFSLSILILKPISNISLCDSNHPRFISQKLVVD